jgi:hypothetical protein
MSEFQAYLQDLLTIDCELQTNLQQLSLIKSRESLEQKSNEIKKNLRQFKDKLSEIKDFCDTIQSTSTSITSGLLPDGIVNRLKSRNRINSNASSSLNSTSSLLSSSPSSSLSSVLSSPKELYINELQIQREHLTSIEARFRNAYLAAQVNIDQMERAKLMEDYNDGSEIDNKKLEAKKANINNQMLLKQSNEMTNKLNEINRQLKWTETQTSDIIPVLETSSKSLRNVQQEFGLMRTSINDGKRLLIRLSRREFTDKLLTILCLCFFFTVVFYIVWKRLF